MRRARCAQLPRDRRPRATVAPCAGWLCAAPQAPPDQRATARRSIARCCARRAPAGSSATLGPPSPCPPARSLQACRPPKARAPWSPDAHQRVSAPDGRHRTARRAAARSRTPPHWDSPAHCARAAADRGPSSFGSRRALPAILPASAGELTTRRRAQTRPPASPVRWRVRRVRSRPVEPPSSASIAQNWRGCRVALRSRTKPAVANLHLALLPGGHPSSALCAILGTYPPTVGRGKCAAKNTHPPTYHIRKLEETPASQGVCSSKRRHASHRS